MSIILEGHIAERIEQQALAQNKTPEALVSDAIQLLLDHQRDEGIRRGIDDFENGRVKEVNLENVNAFSRNIVAKALQ